MVFARSTIVGYDDRHASFISIFRLCDHGGPQVSQMAVLARYCDTLSPCSPCPVCEPTFRSPHRCIPPQNYRTSNPHPRSHDSMTIYSDGSLTATTAAGSEELACYVETVDVQPRIAFFSMAGLRHTFIPNVSHTMFKMAMLSVAPPSLFPNPLGIHFVRFRRPFFIDRSFDPLCLRRDDAKRHCPRFNWH